MRRTATLLISVAVAACQPVEGPISWLDRPTADSSGVGGGGKSGTWSDRPTSASTGVGGGGDQDDERGGDDGDDAVDTTPTDLDTSLDAVDSAEGSGVAAEDEAEAEFAQLTVFGYKPDPVLVTVVCAQSIHWLTGALLWACWWRRRWTLRRPGWSG